MGGVKVYRFWGSPFSMRVEIALQMKGIEYEILEEDLFNKSEQLLKYNPIHKKVPVMIHDGKAMAESLVILEYIDETWKGNPILPSDPFERAQARFWAKFVDYKLTPTIITALLHKGVRSEKATLEVKELLQILENEIKGKQFFGGKNIGFLDIVAAIIPFWITCLQAASSKEVFTREEYPWICTWADQMLGCKIIKQNLPDHEKLKEFYQGRFAFMNAKGYQ